MVLCLGMCHKIPSHLFQKCGMKNRTRFLDITTLSRTLGGSVCDSLIGMHAFTGCDTVSAFAGRGKMTTLKQVKIDKTYQDAFHELGRSWEVSPELFGKLQEITCHMYLSCSVRDVERWSQVNSLLVRTASSCMHCVQTTRLRSGGEVYRASHLLRTQQTAAG